MKTLRERLVKRQLISQGTLATCFRAHEVVFSRTVFLKLLNPVVAGDPEMRSRFEREAQAVARLNHPRLVRLYEFGEVDDEGMYMLLEWVEGETLQEKLKRCQTLSPSETYTLAQQLFVALDALHSVGVIHRDIKPENILQCTDGNFKLTDFSLAAITDCPRLTHHQAVVGTPAYMSPEQAAGKLVDSRSDLFTVGIVLYEALTGINPFAADDVFETLNRIRNLHLPFSGSVFESLPKDLNFVIQSCLVKKVTDRPESAKAALSMLESPSEARAWRAKSTRRKYFLPVMAGIACALMLLLFFFGYHRREIPVLKEMQPDSLSKSLIENPQTVADTSQAFEVPILSQMKTQPEQKTQEVTQAQNAVDTIRSDSSSTTVEKLLSQTDSAHVLMDIRPWAHIYFANQRLGTTPLRKPIVLPMGRQTFKLLNPAYPSLELSFIIKSDPDTLQIDLGKYVTTLEFEVVPWGNVFIGDDSYGTTPFSNPLFVLPGSHKLKITHPSLGTVERDFNSHAGDTLIVRADLDHSQVSFATNHRVTNSSE